MLLEKGADMYLTTKLGINSMIVAAIRQQLEVMQIFLDHGMDINRPSGEKGFTPLLLAIASGKEKSAEFLLKHKADPNQRVNATPPIFMAVNAGRLDLVELLYQYGAILDETTDNGATPLMFACSKGDEKMAKWFLEKNCNVNAVTIDHGNTCLISACDKGSEALISMLLDRGADVKARTNSGGNALYNAGTFFSSQF